MTNSIRRSYFRIMQEIRYSQVFKRFQDFTMVPELQYKINLKIALRYSSVKGAIVECGTWKGGMIGGIASLLGSSKEYVLCDSFEGLPAVKEIDGESARAWQMNKGSKDYHNNCRADESDAVTAMDLAGISKPTIFKGWFNNTLPNAKFQEGISILRMDADWYEPTMEILTNLFFKVNKGGVIMIDDYYSWEGCSKAVHDFLSAHKCAERIESDRGVCFIEKK